MSLYYTCTRVFSLWLDFELLHVDTLFDLGGFARGHVFSLVGNLSGFRRSGKQIKRSSVDSIFHSQDL